MLDQEQAWRLTRLVFWGTLIFIVLKLVVASLLIKVEPWPLDLKINFLGCSYAGSCYLREKTGNGRPSTPDAVFEVVVRVGTEIRA